MGEAGRLFHTVIVIGAAMTSPCCGADEEMTPSTTPDDRDGQAGRSDGSGGSDAGDGSGAAGTGGEVDASLAGMPGALDAGKDAAQSDGSEAAVCSVRVCETTAKVEGCGDCKDNDRDGKVDVDDPDCLNACDTFEGCTIPLCPSGSQPCGVSCLPPCPTGYFCFTGCCGMIA